MVDGRNRVAVWCRWWMCNCWLCEKRDRGESGKKIIEPQPNQKDNDNTIMPQGIHKPWESRACSVFLTCSTFKKTHGYGGLRNTFRIGRHIGGVKAFEKIKNSDRHHYQTDCSVSVLPEHITMNVKKCSLSHAHNLNYSKLHRTPNVSISTMLARTSLPAYISSRVFNKHTPPSPLQPSCSN